MAYTFPTDCPSLASATFTATTYYVRVRGGREIVLEDIVSKAQVQLTKTSGTYRNTGPAIINQTPGSASWVYLKGVPSSAWVYGTDVWFSDEIKGIEPHFHNSVETHWEYTNSAGAKFHIPMKDFRGDGTKPSRII